MTCQQLIDFLNDYVDGELSADARQRFEAHLTACRDCRDYLGQYRRSVELTKSVAADDAGTDLPPSLVKAIVEAMKK
jgi:anti-sigma factor RsiW